MKKLLMGIFGLMLLLPLGVNAGVVSDALLDSVNTGSNSVDTNVTVGDVDVPVYEVTINWYSTTFDWKFTGDKYEWVAAKVCEKRYYPNSDQYNIHAVVKYRDSACSIVSEGYDEAISDYYYLDQTGVYEDGSALIMIVDETENGRVVPSISWNQSSNYEYVEGIFSYENNESGDDEVLTGTELPDSAIVYGTGSPRYEIKLKLQNKEKPTKTPTTGDTIGTITISIKAAE